MPLPKDRTYTSEDYWNLPEGERAELIGGKFYAMAPPSFIHQKLVSELHHAIKNYISSKNGQCEIIPAPFAVNLNADGEDWIEPDISVICDKNKLTDRGCSGAPDFIIEIVSPSSRKMDYVIKAALYLEAGVKEYWIVDPSRHCTTSYHFEEDAAPVITPFSVPLTVKIYGDLTIAIDELLQSNF